MDIHKPKPWHNVREFLKEYAIIVVGVLTALGAEQAVEWLHWRHLAAEAEHDLAAGMRSNLINAYGLVVMEPCGKAQVAELAAALQKPGPDWQGRPMSGAPASQGDYVLPRVYLYTGRLWSHAAWDTALTSGVLNHMPKDRVARYADLYRIVDSTSTMLRTENPAVSRLTPLAYDRKLTEPERAHYLEMVGELDYATVSFARASRSLLAEAHTLGLDLTPDEATAAVQRQREARGPCATAIKLPLSAGG